MEFKSFNLPINILQQIVTSVDKILQRSSDYKSGDDYLLTPMGMMALDSICMQFIAIGESLKRFDKATQGNVLPKFKRVNWKEFMGLRDVVAHKYFDIDAEMIQWIIDNELSTFKETLFEIIEYLYEGSEANQ